MKTRHALCISILFAFCVTAYSQTVQWTYTPPSVDPSVAGAYVSDIRATLLGDTAILINHSTPPVGLVATRVILISKTGKEIFSTLVTDTAFLRIIGVTATRVWVELQSGGIRGFTMKGKTLVQTDINLTSGESVLPRNAAAYYTDLNGFFVCESANGRTTKITRYRL